MIFVKSVVKFLGTVPTLPERDALNVDEREPGVINDLQILFSSLGPRFVAQDCRRSMRVDGAVRDRMHRTLTGTKISPFRIQESLQGEKPQQHLQTGVENGGLQTILGVLCSAHQGHGSPPAFPVRPTTNTPFLGTSAHSGSRSRQIGSSTPRDQTKPDSGSEFVRDRPRYTLIPRTASRVRARAHPRCRRKNSGIHREFV